MLIDGIFFHIGKSDGVIGHWKLQENTYRRIDESMRLLCYCSGTMDTMEMTGINKSQNQCLNLDCEV